MQLKWNPISKSNVAQNLKQPMVIQENTGMAVENIPNEDL